MLLFLFSLWVSFAQSSLVLREDWKDDPSASRPVASGHLSNPNLQLGLYGPGKTGIQYVHPPNQPTYISLSGCGARCAFTLRDRNNYLDLTAPASRIRWRTIQDGFYEFRIVVKLADGAWLISDHNQGGLLDWVDEAFNIPDYRWQKMNIDTLTEGLSVERPDFRKVDEIGCSCHTADGGACAITTPAGELRLDWIEVYGAKVPRT